MKRIEFTRVKNDINGNPRYACHFNNLLTQRDIKNIVYVGSKGFKSGSITIGKRKRQVYKTAFEYSYILAVGNAILLGGRKYDTKEYPNHIVFQSYNIHDTTQRILALLKQGEIQNEAINY